MGEGKGERGELSNRQNAKEREGLTTAFRSGGGKITISTSLRRRERKNLFRKRGKGEKNVIIEKGDTPKPLERLPQDASQKKEGKDYDVTVSKGEGITVESWHWGGKGNIRSVLRGTCHPHRKEEAVWAALKSTERRIKPDAKSGKARYRTEKGLGAEFKGGGHVQSGTRNEKNLRAGSRRVTEKKRTLRQRL